MEDLLGGFGCKKSNMDSGNVPGNPVMSNGSNAVRKLLGAKVSNVNVGKLNIDVALGFIPWLCALSGA